jgi:hypothetical protein
MADITRRVMNEIVNGITTTTVIITTTGSTIEDKQDGWSLRDVAHVELGASRCAWSYLTFLVSGELPRLIAVSAFCKIGEMKILIQNKSTKEYYAGEGRWIPERDEAFVYKGAQEAMKECVRQKFKGAQILLTADDPAQELKLPCIH